MSIWRNVGSGDADQPASMGHWIAIELAQPAPNVDAIGAWVHDLPATPEKVTKTAAMVAGNAAHLARLLKGANYPGQTG